MAIGWYIVPYKRRVGASRPMRYCAMDDYTPQIVYADGGNWSESEVLGGYAVVKVSAASSTLATLDGAEDFYRCPVDALSTGLVAITPAQATAFRNLILGLGYTSGEITAALGSNIRQRTLGEVLNFVATRRRKPRYDSGTDTIVLDGPERPCRSISDVDNMVS